MKYYFISFSYQGKNQGVIQTQAESLDKALNKIKDIMPKYDHMLPYTLNGKDDLECDVLHTPESLMKKGYKRIKNQRKLTD